MAPRTSSYPFRPTTGSSAPNRALANVIYLAACFLANLVMSVVGRLGDLFGLATAFSIAAVAPLVGAAMVWLLPKAAPQPA